MTSRELPANPEQWPADPFALLGVPDSAGADDVRRAYTRLVRKYRPDDSPREFQRVRQAYEEATQRIEWRQRFEEMEATRRGAAHDDEAEPAASDHTPNGDTSGPSTFERSAAVPTVSERPSPESSDTAAGQYSLTGEYRSPESPSEASPLGSSHEPASSDQSRRRRAARMAAAWNQARDGDVAAAQAALVELRDEKRDDPEPHLRLFWLHRLAPELAPSRQPGEWLLEGLAATGLSSRLLDVYCDELRRAPSLVRHEPGRRLLDVEAPVARLSEAAAARWRAAVIVKAWDVVVDDLDRLRHRLQVDDPDSWVRFLFLAMDNVAWAEEPEALPLLDRCRQELRDCRDRELALAEEFDRNAFLQELAGARLVLGNQTFGERLRRLIRVSWNATLDELRPELQHVAAEWLANPAARLDDITRMATLSPVVYEQLCRAVRRWPIPQSLSPSGARVVRAEPLLIHFFTSFAGTVYSQWRGRFLEFCLREMIWPDEAVHFLMNGTRIPMHEQFAAHIQSDGPLYCLQHAGMALQAEMG